MIAVKLEILKIELFDLEYNLCLFREGEEVFLIAKAVRSCGAFDGPNPCVIESSEKISWSSTAVTLLQQSKRMSPVVFEKAWNAPKNAQRLNRSCRLCAAHISDLPTELFDYSGD